MKAVQVNMNVNPGFISAPFLTWVGVGPAGPGRGRTGSDTSRALLRSGHRGSAVRPFLLHHAGGSLCPPRLHGRRPPGAGRGPHPGGAARGTLVGSRNRSPPGRLAPAATGDATGGGENLLPAGLGNRPPPGGQVAGAAGRYEPGPAVAAAG